MEKNQIVEWTAQNINVALARYAEEDYKEFLVLAIESHMLKLGESWMDISEAGLSCRKGKITDFTYNRICPFDSELGTAPSEYYPGGAHIDTSELEIADLEKLVEFLMSRT